MSMRATVEDALNNQINAEFYSAYLYLSMEAYFESINLKGFANWMRVQVQEEMTHAMKIYDYIHDRGAKVTLGQIQTPKISWMSPLEVFEDAYGHEVLVTRLINDLVNTSEKDKDRSATSFLQWYVDEQVEEEASTDEIRKKLMMIKDSPGSLLLLDQKLAQRIFTNGAMVPSSLNAKKQQKSVPGGA